MPRRVLLRKVLALHERCRAGADRRRAVQTWPAAFHADFACRLLTLLSGAFRDMEPAVALSLLQPKLTFSRQETDRAKDGGVTIAKAGGQIGAYDLKRLQARCPPTQPQT